MRRIDIHRYEGKTTERKRHSGNKRYHFRTRGLNRVFFMDGKTQGARTRGTLREIPQPYWRRHSAENARAP